MEISNQSVGRPTRWALRTAVLLVAFFFAADAMAFSRHGDDSDRAGPGPRTLVEGLERHADRLGLSDEVIAQMQSVAAAARAAEETDRSQQDDLRTEIRSLVEAEPVDSDAIMALVDEAGALETAAKKRRLTSLLEIRAMLTAEQREQLSELRDKKLRAHARERSRSRW
jgi:Spy/CpxP family protein refolding chaperone